MHQHKKRKTHTKTPLLGKLLLLLPVSCIIFYPLWLANQLFLKEKTVESPLVPAAFDGFKIVFLSDIHYGAYFRDDRVRQLAEKINALDADIVIFGGDYGQKPADSVRFFEALPTIRARCGVVGVIGNHDKTDTEGDLPTLENAMRSAGVTPLVNDAVIIERDGQTIAFAGIDDYYNGSPDLEKAREAAPNADYTVLVSHTPDILPDIEAPFFKLLLCGHTHGGQVAPFGFAPRSSSNYGNRYRSGWFHEKNVDMLVSNGVGTSILPIRLGAEPQYHLLTFKSSRQQQKQ